MKWMEASGGIFEPLTHTVYGGESHLLPLFVNPRTGLVEDSQALLQATNIIGGHLNERGVDIQTMLEHLAEGLQDEDPERQAKPGVILEDTLGKGSLQIGPDKTKVNVHEVGSWDVDTELFFEMLTYWANLQEKKGT